MTAGQNSTFGTQLITVERLAWIFDVSPRTVATWTGGRKKKPQITLFRNGHVICFTPAAVLEFILAHTVRAYHPAGLVPRLAEEDFERLAQRMERFLEIQLAARERKARTDGEGSDKSKLVPCVCGHWCTAEGDQETAELALDPKSPKKIREVAA
jgi:hypothetical protein